MITCMCAVAVTARDASAERGRVRRRLVGRPAVGPVRARAQQHIYGLCGGGASYRGQSPHDGGGAADREHVHKEWDGGSVCEGSC